VLYILPALAPAGLALALLVLRRRPGLGLSTAATVYGFVTAETLRRHPPSVAIATPLVATAHHLAYGTAFLRGLLGRRITR
jgi:hypothetical protein